MAEDDVADSAATERFEEKKATKLEWIEKADKCKPQIMFFQEVLRWAPQRIPHFLGIWVLLNVSLWYIFHTKLSMLTIVALVAVAAIVLHHYIYIPRLILDYMNPLPIPAEGYPPSTYSLMSFPEIISGAVNIYFGFKDHVARVRNYRQEFALQFTLYACGILLFIALAGDVLPLYCIFMAVMNSLLLAPGIITYDLHTKVWAILEPHYQEISTKIKDRLQQRKDMKADAKKLE